MTELEKQLRRTKEEYLYLESLFQQERKYGYYTEPHFNPYCYHPIPPIRKLDIRSTDSAPSVPTKEKNMDITKKTVEVTTIHHSGYSFTLTHLDCGKIEVGGFHDDKGSPLKIKVTKEGIKALYKLFGNLLIDGGK